MPPIKAWLRADDRKGIRNTVQIVYLVECAHHVATKIAAAFSDDDVNVIGFGGCYPNAYAHKMLCQLCTHPNVGAVLLVSLGCEGFDRRALLDVIRASGRPVELIGIQATGGTRKTIATGQEWVRCALTDLAALPRVDMAVEELIIGTVCGGSDAMSGITANPAVGDCFDRLVAAGATCIFEETGELIGCEHIMAARAATPALGEELVRSVEKAAAYYAVLGHGSFAPGNADGGLTTLEEKSMGAYAKSGSSRINGMLQPGDVPRGRGLHLLDVVPDGEVRFGFPNINDNAEIAELIACGSHVIVFTTGRGSVVGSAISPVIKVCANPETYRRMTDDMDVNAGRIVEGAAAIADVGAEIFGLVVAVAAGQKTCSEQLGHREFVLTYKAFAPPSPACAC
ncbi:MAG: UxaA family hydrolase [Candidatus Didemnitutus sp.]|nr:UxaA family hydrolase [Candidatus Didemnitutus sp.]